MREATGQAGLMNIMLTIMGVIIILLAGSIAYSKAFRVKNKIVDIIEKNKGYNRESLDEITRTLNAIGYRKMSSADYVLQCGSGADTSAYPNHLFCVYKNNDSSGNYYYTVAAYMYLDLPIIGQYLKIPVKGETKIFYPEDWKTVE